MTSKAILKLLGGMERVKEVCKKTADRYGVGIEAALHRNEADPTDRRGDFLNIVFTIARYDGDYEQYLKAGMAINRWLMKKELHLSLECTGDGERGTEMSFRVA